MKFGSYYVDAYADDLAIADADRARAYDQTVLHDENA